MTLAWPNTTFPGAPSIDLPVETPLDRRSARVISVACGHSGVGKTTLAANLSLALSAKRRRSMLVDSDPGAGDATRSLGIDTRESIDDVVAGRLTIDQIVVDGPQALFVVPAGRDDGRRRQVDILARRKLADAFRPHRRSLDYVIVDTPGAVDPDTLDLVASSDLVVVMLCPQSDRFMDAYATVKLLATEHDVADIAIVTNRIESDVMGRDMFRRFRDVSARFLKNVSFSYLGGIPDDEQVRAAAARRRCVIDHFPNARASQAIAGIAREIEAMAIGAHSGGDCFFGMEAVARAR
ncbi:MAG: MinD/ParA family protein [Rhizorhabdus sp.]|nr:MinD/ParA family protein [Rhizorhabdus sp.]